MTLWERLDVAHAALSGGLFDRQAKCQRTRRVFLADVPLNRSDRGAWRAGALVTCGHWTCPSCGPYLAREVAATLGASIERWFGGSEGKYVDEDTLDVWMLTLTVPHSREDDVGVLVESLYKAASTFFRSRTWQRFEEEFGVRARVRVLDVTFGGPNGTHPHFHCALFLDGARPGFRHESRKSRERELAELDALPMLYTDRSLVDAWEAAVRQAGVELRDVDAFRDFAAKVSPSERAVAYFVKWGLADEVSNTPLKRDNHLRLLDAAGGGDDACAQMYVVWRAAVDGRQWVTGLADLRAKLGVTDDDLDTYIAELRRKRDEAEPPKLVAPISVVVRAHLWTRCLAVGMPTVLAEIDRAELAGEDPQAALDAFLWRVNPANRRRTKPPDG